MTSAPDELRALLDERGVEWDYGITGATTTRFCVNGIDLTFAPMRDGLVCSTILTPEQAIATTLGRGTCKMVVDNHHRVDKVTTSWGCVCSACGSFHQYSHGEGWAYCPSCSAKVVEG